MTEKRKRYKHRCMNCENCYLDDSLAYMKEYQCLANNHHHIFIGVTGASERPTWCPLYGPEDPDKEEIEYV